MSVALKPTLKQLGTEDNNKHYTSGLNNEFGGTIFGCGLTVNWCSSKQSQQHDGLFEVIIKEATGTILHKFNVKTHIFC